MRKLCLALLTTALATLAACETDSSFEPPPSATHIPVTPLATPASTASTASPPVPPAMPDGVSYSGGDGSSIAEAVIVGGVTSTRASTRAEYAFLRNRYPGFRRKAQDLVRSGNRYYDALSFDLPGGGSKTVYFDVTGTFGKR
jgi:hypothetical protein